MTTLKQQMIEDAEQILFNTEEFASMGTYAAGSTTASIGSLSTKIKTGWAMAPLTPPSAAWCLKLMSLNTTALSPVKVKCGALLWL